MNTEHVNNNEVNAETEKVETVVFNKTKKKDIKMIDPRRLIVSGLNTRVDMGDIDGLMNSIILNGLETPFTGYAEGENYVVIAGHRRREAILKAISLGHNIALVPIAARRKPLAEEFLFQTLLSNDGKNMSALELGETYKQLINFGFTVTEIATRVGKTYKHVSDMISVANSSKETKELIKDGLISATLVAEVRATVKDDEEAENVIKKAVEDKKESIAKAELEEASEEMETEKVADEKATEEKAKKAKAKAKKKAKVKVTKKDIEVLTKPTEKMFTLGEVTEMLKLQRSMCASVLVDEIDQGLVRSVSLALPKEKVTEKEMA